MAIVTRLFEFTYIAFFILIVFSNYKRQNRRAIMELFSIALFALNLEYLAIKTYDAYQYSPDFIFQFGAQPDNVPIVIALAWAIIISVSMKISDTTRIQANARPYLDTLFALTIDLSMDVIAIRIEQGFWNWKIQLSNSITFNSFIGVRYGNFIGWYFIVLIFSVLIRYGRDKFWLSDKKYLIYLTVIPDLAFIPFYICFETIQKGKSILNYDPYFVSVVLLLIGFALYKILNGLNSNRTVPPSNLTSVELVAIYSFHLFFLIAFFVLAIYRSTPLIILPSLLAIIIHFTLHYYLLSSSEYEIKKMISSYSIGK